MRLRDYKFEKEGDYFVIKTLLRILKENMFNNNNVIQTNDILIRKGGAKYIIEKCYLSRKCNKSESKIINYCYWPYDAGFGLHNSLYMVYIANIIKEFKESMTQKEYKFVSKTLFDELSSYLFAKGGSTYGPGVKADEFVFSNLEVLEEALSTLDKRFADIMITIMYSEKGLKNIPF